MPAGALAVSCLLAFATTADIEAQEPVGTAAVYTRSVSDWLGEGSSVALQEDAWVCHSTSAPAPGEIPADQCLGWRRTSKVTQGMVDGEFEIVLEYGEGHCAGAAESCSALSAGELRRGVLSLAEGKVRPGSGQEAAAGLLTLREALLTLAKLPRAGYFGSDQGELSTIFEPVALRFLLPQLPGDCSARLTPTAGLEPAVSATVDVACSETGAEMQGTLMAVEDGARVEITLTYKGRLVVPFASPGISSAPGVAGQLHYVRIARRVP